jgi:glucose-6-phosphate 1-dehydrogenase
VSRADAPTTGPTQADVLVIFGITGDLARVMTFRSLYLLEARGILDCPVVGVAFEDWSLEQLVARARASIVDTGEELDEAVFARFVKRLSYRHGDFKDASTYAAVAKAIEGKSTPVFYLEIPPSLFGTVVAGLAKEGLTEKGRVVVEKPFGHDLASARALNAELHASVDESRLYRIDHFLGKLSVEDIMYLRFANTVLEPIWTRHFVSSVMITMGEDFDVGDRGNFYDPVGAMRDVVQNHLLQVLSIVAMEPPAGGTGDVIRNRKRDVFLAMSDADPADYVRGQYLGYLDVPGVAPGSQTETYCALRLEIDNWRWSGVPFFIRAGKSLPVTVTEVRIVFRSTPWLGLAPRGTPRPPANELVLRIGPRPGARLSMQAKGIDEAALLRTVELDMDFASMGGEGPTAYEVLLEAALRGDWVHFARQDVVEEMWRVVEPLIEAPPPVEVYEPGTWGPASADDLTREQGGWREPWLA